MSIVNVTNVVQDGCTAHAAADPPVGPTVDDMATALAALSPFILTKPPSDVTVDGFSGKHLELTVPDLAVQVTGDDTAFTDCTDGELKSWIGEPLSYAFHGYSYPGQVEEIWLLDVDGTRLMIQTLLVARFARRRHRRAALDPRLDRHRSVGRSPTVEPRGDPTGRKQRQVSRDGRACGKATNLPHATIISSFERCATAVSTIPGVIGCVGNS